MAEKEAGGITQKIGAYKLRTAEGTIVFIDTPGHEAFTNLRARGAKVTDIWSSWSWPPTTACSRKPSKPSTTPWRPACRMIVAINKIDIAGADIEKIKQDLNKHNVLVEELGRQRGFG